MSPSHPHITAAILAGGRSTRMGSPKHLLQLPDGRTLIRAVADTLLQVTSNLVILSNAVALENAPHIPDIHQGLGPLSGIHALLITNHSHEYLICPCDTPFITADLLRLLLTPTPSLVSVFSFGADSDPEPLPMRISSSAIPCVTQTIHSADHSLRALLQRLSPHRVPLSADSRPFLANINTPSDFRASFP
ncbi:MAG TPA: molybdenum cofactor guanylyltransferase [Phycisphaerales bacterium]|nr:molybdenum cofactor guanylyltransferase [Phycisphaerales bacterium]